MNSVGSIVKDARNAKGWSRATLAERSGYSAVMIAKIESGQRAPSGEKVAALAQALDLDESLLSQSAPQPDRRTSNAPKIVRAMELAKRNSERARALQGRAANLEQRAVDVAEQLDQAVHNFDKSLIEPLSALLSGTRGTPEDVFVRPSSGFGGRQLDFADRLEEAHTQTSRGIYSLVGAGVLGARSADAIKLGTASPSYVMAASIAGAATGAAIGTATRVASIGAGSLAAGSLGVAGGTALATGLVWLPAGAAVGAALVASGGRTLTTQQAIERRIDIAEDEFEANAAIIEDFIDRASRILETLRFGITAGSNNLSQLASFLPSGSTSNWSDLDDRAQDLVRRVVEIALVCLTVLSLPIGMNLKRAEGDTGVDGDDDFLPQLDGRSDEENEFIDFAIEESYRAVVR